MAKNTPASGTSRIRPADRSVLDRRRNKLRKAKATAAGAVSDLRRLDEQLASNGDQHRQQEASLQDALDRVLQLKKAIKASVKKAGDLRAARKKVGKRAAEAQQRVTAAEAKYDRAVLSDMVRREKESDLTAHAKISGTPDADAHSFSMHSSLTTGDLEGPGLAVDATRHAYDQPLAAAAGTDTARATAARQTAISAHATHAMPESRLEHPDGGTT